MLTQTYIQNYNIFNNLQAWGKEKLYILCFIHKIGYILYIICQHFATMMDMFSNYSQFRNYNNILGYSNYYNCITKTEIENTSSIVIQIQRRFLLLTPNISSHF